MIVSYCNGKFSKFRCRDSFTSTKNPKKSNRMHLQAGGGVLYNGDNVGSSVTYSNSSMSNNYVDSPYSGTTTLGLGGE